MYDSPFNNEQLLTPLLKTSPSAIRIEDKNELGTLNGCYVPCLLNIMGVILFLRLGWAIGEAGVAGVLLMFLIAETMTLLTVLSLSAMLTNGAMKGGGSYFMISRALGPEFGGSVGILFWAAYAVGASFYIVGFAEEVRNSWYPEQADNQWFVAGIGSAGLFGVLLISLAGARFFTKINVLLFLVQFSAILVALIAMFVRDNVKLVEGEFVPWNWKNLKSHWWSEYESDKLLCDGACTFVVVFGVVFPAATGIMEGANLSGDLKDPDFSIPRGTLAAVFTSIVFYFLLILGYAGCVDRHGLKTNLTVMQDIGWSDMYVIIGILVSTVSSSLGAIFGGSRVLQALARDRIFPGMNWLRYGTKKGDEPICAVFVTWAIAQACTLIGNLNMIAPIISSFFCLSYATVNLSCFLLDISGTPNFRPHWKYYSKWTAALGFIMAMAINFYLDVTFAVVAILIMIMLFVYLLYRGPEVAWGDVTQSLVFHQVRKYLLRMDSRKHHNKLWRPSIMLLQFDLDVTLIDFCNILKKGGLYVIGNIVITHDFQETAAEALKNQRAWLKFITKSKIKAFTQTAVAPSFRIGCQNLLMMGGIGALTPNTVVVPLVFDEEGKDKAMSSSLKSKLGNFIEKKKSARRFSQLLSGCELLSGYESQVINDMSMKSQNMSNNKLNITEYMGILRDILVSNRNVLIAENFEKYDDELLNSLSIQQWVRKSLNQDKDKLKTQNAKMRPPINYNSLREDSVSSALELEPVAPVPVDTIKLIDVWINCIAYTWDTDSSRRDSGFPALMMQLAFIISQNPRFARRSRIRAILLVQQGHDQEEAQIVFLKCCKTLRLTVDSVLCVEWAAERFLWEEVLDNRLTGSIQTILKSPKQGDAEVSVDRVRSAKALNSLLVEHSADTYIAFFALPELPPRQLDDPGLEKKLGHSWLLYMLTLINDIPCPIAFVKTGEIVPVISTEM